MGTLKPHSNGPLYSNTVISTLAVGWRASPLLAVPLIGALAADGWAATFSTASRGLGGLGPPAQSPPRCTKCNSPLIIITSVPTSYYLTWHYNCLWALKG